MDSYGLGRELPGGYFSYLFVRLPFLNPAVWKLMRRSRRPIALSLQAVMRPERVTGEMVDEIEVLLRRPDAGEAFIEFQSHEVGPGGLKTDYRDRFPDFRVPVLFVHGERDPAVPVAWAKLAVIPDCGHVPPRERPEEFNRIVREYLSAPE